MSNSISFSGRLGSDAETRYLENGKSVTSFRVANNVGWGERQSTNWFRCTIWGDRGSKVEPYLKKGTQVVIHGEFQAREWTDQEGQTKLSLDVTVRELDLVGPKEGAQPKPAPQPAAAGGADLDEDVPFAPLAKRNEYLV